MSFENQYQSRPQLNDVAALCEAVLSNEKWDNLSEDFDYWGQESVQICEGLRKSFEDQQRVVQKTEALEVIQSAPASLSYITLENPKITLINEKSETEVPLAVFGQITVAYADIAVAETFYVDSSSYRGPQLKVIVDTSFLESDKLSAASLEQGYYQGKIPFRIADVVSSYTPHLMN